MLNETELADLLRALRSASALDRLNHTEALTVIERMQERGWKITPPIPEKAVV
jgi:hypothetical protein